MADANSPSLSWFYRWRYTALVVAAPAGAAVLWFMAMITADPFDELDCR
jgi:hypothetical protein